MFTVDQTPINERDNCYNTYFGANKLEKDTFIADEKEREMER